MDIAVITTIGTAVGAFVAAFVASRRLWRQRLAPFFDGIVKAMTVINGREAIVLPEDPNVELSPAIPGALERLSQIEQGQGAMVMHVGHLRMDTEKLKKDCESIAAEVSEVKHEVQTNSGGSLKDAVKRIEEQGADITSHLQRIDERLENGDDRFSSIEGTIEDALTERDQWRADRHKADKAMWNAVEAVAKSSPPDGEGLAEGSS